MQNTCPTFSNLFSILYQKKTIDSVKAMSSNQVPIDMFSFLRQAKDQRVITQREQKGICPSITETTQGGSKESFGTDDSKRVSREDSADNKIQLGDENFLGVLLLLLYVCYLTV